MAQENQSAVFGGGCFWCIEAVFEELKGISSVVSGYAGGQTKNPTYESVSGGKTGHAEVIKIDYDPSQISFKDLLTVFFATHDPSTANRQGNDVGPQYRSIILYTSEEQRHQAEAFIKELNASSNEGKPIVTELKPLDVFYEAEQYHQDYYRNNPEKAYCEIIINPKLQKVQQQFADLLKTAAK